jgi:hypothetical protein
MLDAIGASMERHAGTLSLAIEFDLDVRKMFSIENIAMNFGAEAAGLGFETDGTLDVSAAFSFIDDAGLPKFTFGIDLTPDPDVRFAERFYLSARRATLTAEVHATALDFAARFGFLGVGVADGAIDLEASIELVFLRDKITLADINQMPLESLVEVRPPVGTLDAYLPLVAEAGLGVSFNAEVGTVTLSSHNVFDPAAYHFAFVDNFGDLANFSNMDAGTLVSLLGQINAWLDDFRRGFGGVDIPFVGPALDEVLAFADLTTAATASTARRGSLRTSMLLWRRLGSKDESLRKGRRRVAASEFACSRSTRRSRRLRSPP